MIFNGALADPQVGGNNFAWLSIKNEFKYLMLPLCEVKIWQAACCGMDRI